MTPLARTARVGAQKVAIAALHGGLSGIAVHQLLEGSTWRVFVAAAGAAALPVATEAARRLQQAAQELRWPDPWPEVE